MRKLKYVNSQGAEIEFGYTAPLILQKFEDKTDVNIYNSKSMNQDGMSYLGNTLGARDLSLQIAVLTETPGQLLQVKRKIDKVFNPKLGEGFLIYSDSESERKIKCIADELPFWVKETNTHETCLIILIANDPFWQAPATNKEEVAIWRGAFEFPLEILEEGIEMGYREPSLIVNVLNQGDVSCGMRIQFKALATVINPSLFNVNTREYFKINKVIEAGEVITVTTHFQNKRVELNRNGEISNAFNWIDLESTFLQLGVGDNLLRYDADDGLDNLEVSIWYTPQYLGV